MCGRFVLPLGFDQFRFFQTPQGRVNRAARQSGDIHDVKAIMIVMRNRLQDRRSGEREIYFIGHASCIAYYIAESKGVFVRFPGAALWVRRAKSLREQRGCGADYGVRRFDSALDSVRTASGSERDKDSTSGTQPSRIELLCKVTADPLTTVRGSVSRD